MVEIGGQHRQLLSHFDCLLKVRDTGQGFEELKIVLGFLDGRF
jgi:hypothetical protein